MRTFCIAFLLVLVLFTGLCFGQTQAARLQGIVHDASGAIVPNAKVVAVNNQTKDASDATTNTSGLYVLPALRPGTYTLTVEAAGFSKTTVTDIELAVSASIAQDVKLEIGKLTEVVEVRGERGDGGDHGRPGECRGHHARYRHAAATGAHPAHPRHLPAGRTDLAERLQHRHRYQLFARQRTAAGQQQQHPRRHRRQ